MNQIVKVQCNTKKDETAGLTIMELAWETADGQHLQSNIEIKDQSDTKFKIMVDQENDLMILSGMTDGYFPGCRRHGTGKNDHDIFVAKVNVKGEAIFFQWGSTGNDELQGALNFSNGSALYFGTTWGNFENFERVADKDPAEGDLFLTNLAADGTIATVQFGSNRHDTINQVSLDNAGHLIVRGSTTGAFPGCTHNGGPDDQDSFVAMVEENGSLIVIQWGSDGDDVVDDMIVDGSNNLFLLGRTRGVFKGATRMAKEPDDWDLTVTIINRSQHRLRTIQWGSDGSDLIRGMAIEPESGSLLITGHTSGAFPGNTRQAQNDDDCDLFISMLDPSGTISSFQWDTSGSRRIAGLKCVSNGLIQLMTEDRAIKEIRLSELRPVVQPA